MILSIATPSKPKKDKCKGLVFRGYENIFTDGKGKIKSSKELRLLKKKSCSGCDKCLWFFDHLQEVINDEPKMLDNIEDQKLYTFSVSASQDMENGAWDIDYVEFIEVSDNDPKI